MKTRDSKQKTVLVADDSEDTRQALSQFIQVCRKDIKIIFAADGITAKELLMNGDISAAFIDEKMPGKSGIEIIKEINSANFTIPIILITGYNNIHTNINALKAGAFYYISKPFMLEDIKTSLNNALEKKDMFYENLENCYKNYSVNQIRFINNSSFIQDNFSINNVLNFAKIFSENSFIVSISNIFCSMLASRFNADFAFIVMKNIENNNNYYAYGVYGFIPSIRNYRNIDETSVPSKYSLNTLRLICPQDIEFFQDNDIDIKVRNILNSPVFYNNSFLGMVKVINAEKDFDFYNLDNLNRFTEFFLHVLFRIGFSLKKNEYIENSLLRIASFCEYIHQYSCGHSERVGKYCGKIAYRLGWSKNEIKKIKTAGALHDIGKISIPSDILFKKIPLNGKDLKIIQKHPFLSAVFLKGLNIFEDIIPWIYHHHENYDGTGYPMKISGNTIPEGARIIRIADTYDAIRSNRIYKAGKNKKDAIEEIKSHIKYDFDPDIAEIFLNILEKEKDD
ncbi:MAG: response regulator [bacterium]|nr:response regulator [bacterium]